MADFFLTETEMARNHAATVPIEVSATATLARFHGERTWLADTSGGAVVLTLPKAFGCAPGTYAQFVLAVAGNDLTIAAASGDEINGAASVTISTQYASLTLARTAAGWLIMTPATP